MAGNVDHGPDPHAVYHVGGTAGGSEEIGIFPHHPEHKPERRFSGAAHAERRPVQQGVLMEVPRNGAGLEERDGLHRARPYALRLTVAQVAFRRLLRSGAEVYPAVRTGQAADAASEAFCVIDPDDAVRRALRDCADRADIETGRLRALVAGMSHVYVRLGKMNPPDAGSTQPLALFYLAASFIAGGTAGRTPVLFNSQRIVERAHLSPRITLPTLPSRGFLCSPLRASAGGSSLWASGPGFLCRRRCLPSS